MKSKNIIILAAIFCCLLWSSAFAGIKIGLQYTTPMRFAGLRFMIAGLLMMPFCTQKRNYFKIVRKNWKFLLFLALWQTTIYYSVFYWGVQRVEGALCAIIVGSSPLFVAITSHFFLSNDRMTLPKLLTVISGLGGVTLVAIGRNLGNPNAHVQLSGIVLLLIAVIMGSFNNLLIVKDKNNIPPLILSSFITFVGGLGIWLVSIPLEGIPHVMHFPSQYYLALSWLSFVSAAAISIWTKILKRPGIIVSELNFWKFLIPVSGAVLAWLILPDEYPNWITIIGILIIGTSLILLNLYNRGFFSRSRKS